jgi:hypothetical protein
MSEQAARRGFNRQVYGLQSSGCFVAAARPLGVIAGKLQLNHLRRISFCLGINMELNKRGFMGRQVQNERMGSREP